MVCLVGSPPPEWDEGSGEEDVRKALEAVDERLMFYDQLLDNARRAYADYLEEHKKIERLWNIFRELMNFSAPAEGGNDA